MYLKVIRKTHNWIYGLAYLNANVGDVIYDPSPANERMLRDGVVEKPNHTEINAHGAWLEQQAAAALQPPIGLQITLAAPTSELNQKAFNV